MTLSEIFGHHGANKVAAGADIETLDSYENNLEHYRNRNFTYVPIPSARKYYDVEREQLLDLDAEQLLPDDVHIVTAMVHLLKYPFVLLDYHGILSDESDLAAKFGLDHGESNRYGIVTVADLNKRGTRELLYPLMAELETLLAREIEQYYPDSEIPHGLLGDKTVERWEDAKEKDIEMHAAEYMSLGDIMSVVREAEELRENCGFESKSQFDKALGGPTQLRNKVMHPHRTLIEDQEDIEQLLDRLSRVYDVISNLSSQEI